MPNEFSESEKRTAKVAKKILESEGKEAPKHLVLLRIVTKYRGRFEGMSRDERAARILESEGLLAGKPSKPIKVQKNTTYGTVIEDEESFIKRQVLISILGQLDDMCEIIDREPSGFTKDEIEVVAMIQATVHRFARGLRKRSRG